MSKFVHCGCTSKLLAETLRTVVRPTRKTTGQNTHRLLADTYTEMTNSNMWETRG